MNAFVDIHHHLLFGLDDGPAVKADMEQMLAVAWQEGVREIIATPHIAPGIKPFSAEIIRRRTDEAQQACVALGLSLRILPGAEVLYTYQAKRYLAQKRVPTLADTDKLLVEFFPDIRFAELTEALQTLLHSGYVPVLAHIERYPCLMRCPARTAGLKQRYEVLFQINCAALTSKCGFFANRTVQSLLKEGQIDFVASDAHDADRRACHFQDAYAQLSRLVGMPCADTLTGNRRIAEELLIR